MECISICFWKSLNRCFFSKSNFDFFKDYNIFPLFYWKCNIPINPYVRPLVVWCLLHPPRCYRSTCFRKDCPAPPLPSPPPWFRPFCICLAFERFVLVLIMYWPSNLKDSALFPENVSAFFPSVSGVFPALFRNHSGKGRVS